MVLEFLSFKLGNHGQYYKDSGEAVKVAEAIEQHYRPKFSGDTLPSGGLAL